MKKNKLFSKLHVWNCKQPGSQCHLHTWSVQCDQTRKEGEEEEKKNHSTQFFWKLICDPLMKSSSFRIKLNVQRYLSVGISLITQREASDRLMQVLTWAPHVPSICILQWTDTVSAPRYFILRPLKSCWETGVKETVSGICVLGWEGDLVSRDVGLCLQTKIIL